MDELPAEVHQPETSSVAHMDLNTLKLLWEKDLGKDIEVPTTYKKIVAYKGCETCPAFIACQGRSPKQRGTSQMLRSRRFVGDLLDAVSDPGVIIGQLLNLRPETTGLVFKAFNPQNHVKDPVQFYEWVCGKKFNPDNLPEDELEKILYDTGQMSAVLRLIPTKLDIYEGMIRAGWKVSYGIDYGFVDPATAIVVGYHQKTKRACILHSDHTTRDFPMDNKSWSQYVNRKYLASLSRRFCSP